MRLVVACLVLLFTGAAYSAEPSYALRDGDTVAFLGDSITAARGYSKIVELYTLMRYPQRNVRFWNAGKGGDTASGCLERLERDVFSRGATVVTVAFGVNDIGWGMKADEEHKQSYLDGIRRIVEECQKRKVRVFICSPAITAEEPDKAETGYLQKMTDEGMALAKSLGAEAIDLSRGMREIQRRVLDANAKEPDKTKHIKLHVADGVHLNDLGQLAMAFAMLKGLGAPAIVSEATVDATTAALNGSGCELSDLRTLPDGLAFTRKDEGLPMNLGVLSVLNYRFVPVPESINRYLLTVIGLSPGHYTLSAEGRPLGTFTAQQFAKGMNISSMTANGWEPGGPWNAQSDVIKELVDARDKVWIAARMRSLYNQDNPNTQALDAQSWKMEEDIIAHQRTLAKPYAYRFEIRLAKETKK